MSTKQQITVLENTLVGLFDIQGYSAFIESTPRDEVLQKSKKLFSFARSSATNDMGSVKTLHWVLSDTIVIAIDTTRAPLNFWSAYVLFCACSDLLHGGLKFCNLPLRGAIGAGYLCFREGDPTNPFGDGSFILGNALVDAAKHEKEQAWLGVRVTPNATKVLDSFHSEDDGKKLLDCNQMQKFCAYGDIPLKGNRLEKGYYLLPFMRYAEWRNSLPTYFKDSESKLANSERLYGLAD